MDEKQKINCTVETCEYNDTEKKECELNEIVVEASNHTHTGNPDDESMCGSYVQVPEDEWGND